MAVRKQKTMLEKIIAMTKQLYEVANFSPDIRKCIEIAVDQIIGNAEISKHCMALGITKKEYVDYIASKI